MMRRDDGLTVMVIAPGTEVGVWTDEGVMAGDRDEIVLVMKRSPYQNADPPSIYWPLYQTASKSDDSLSFTWEELS